MRRASSILRQSRTDMRGYVLQSTATKTALVEEPREEVDCEPRTTQSPEAQPESPVASAQAAFASGRTLELSWRQKQLEGLVCLLDERKSDIFEAIKLDIGKTDYEIENFDVSFVRDEAVFLLNNLKKFTKPKWVYPGLPYLTNRTYLQPQPLGTALVIGAYNFPLMLTLGPAAGAVAAGNSVVIKPAEQTPCLADLLATTVPQYMDSQAVRVAVGDAAVGAALIQQNPDMVMFTGKSESGRHVLAECGRRLIPCVAELGGKNPCYVDSGANLKIAARRLLWGKMFFSGQACVAPDYVLCHKNSKDQLVHELRNAYTEFYESNSLSSAHAAPLKDCGGAREYRKLRNFQQTSGHAVIGGGFDEDSKDIEFTTLVDVQFTDPVMQEEVFGPLLPIIDVDSAQQAVNYINSRDKSLCTYVFSEDKHVQHLFTSRTQSGGLSINDVIKHAAVKHLPFGGVGSSGQGAYHGKHTFDAFTHYKPVFSRGLVLEAVNRHLLYPPHPPYKSHLFRLLVAEHRVPDWAHHVPHAVAALLGLWLVSKLI